VFSLPPKASLFLKVSLYWNKGWVVKLLITSQLSKYYQRKSICKLSAYFSGFLSLEYNLHSPCCFNSSLITLSKLFLHCFCQYWRFKLKALHVLDRYSNVWTMTPADIFVLYPVCLGVPGVLFIWRKLFYCTWKFLTLILLTTFYK
jgi:hypothetical protein